MKNLVPICERRRSLISDASSVDTVVDICYAVVDDLGPATVVLTREGTVSKVRDDGEVAWTRNLKGICESSMQGGWFNLAYVDPVLVCLSRHGAMVTVAPATGQAELLGEFDYGLEDAAWSPDGEILLMVTSTADDEDESKTNSVLMTMNSQFEVMAEINIPPYVASTAAENASVTVTWRPDGTFCAVSAVDAEDNMRKVRIYKRETLELHAIGRSEDASGAIVKNIQDSGLAWASPGCSQVLAAVQRKGKKTHQVIFFESNGLRHREFALREAPATIVTSMAWNVSSDLLAVVLREESGSDKVQLWHRCNYHWYLKQEIRYSGLQVEMLKFNEERAYEFCVLLKGMKWREYQVRWDSSTTHAINQQCAAFVVDGSSLNITPLHKALIPPPMFMKNITMDFPINEISLCLGQDNNGSFLVRSSNGDIVLLRRSEGEGSYSVTKLAWKETLDTDITSLRSLLVVGGTISSGHLQLIAVIPSDVNREAESLIECEVSVSEYEAIANILQTIPLNGKVFAMTNWADSQSGCLIELEDGSLLEFETNDGDSRVQPSECEPFLEPCPWICAVKDSSPYTKSQHGDHFKMVFGLSTRSRLYYHDILLTDSASSLYLSADHEFLCYASTGSRCFIRFLPLKEISGFDPLMGLDQNHILEGYEPRCVERGARIVAILPSQPMAILQMPRGNLEGVYPRALILRYVMLRIARGKYGEAFVMMRKHKVDLNLLVDFDPWHFYKLGISDFFRQVTVIDHLNLFLSGLQNCDITQSRFPVPSWLRKGIAETESRVTFDFATKVNQICQKSRSIMMDMESCGDKAEGYFLLPVLSTFAKESPPKLDEALGMIKERALKQQIRTAKKPPLFAEKAQSSIHYLAFLAEYELLFETSLGMYDFELARAVARNSQMDPKVYLPLLKRYNALPVSYAKYEVDMRLKRFEAALQNLFTSYKNEESLGAFDASAVAEIAFGNSFESCLALIEKEKLHRLGLQLFEDDIEKLRLIYISLGESLMQQGQADAALEAFLAANPLALDQAKRAARGAGDWKTFFALFENESNLNTDTNYSEQRRQIARDIARDMTSEETEFTSLAKQSLHSDAARILLDYGEDLIGAVDLLINAQCWSEAHRIAHFHKRQDLLKRCFDAVVEYAHVAIDDFQEKVSSFESTLQRYGEVLLLRKKNVFEEGPAAVDDADETGSLFSAASNMSEMSLQSGTSSSSTGSAVSSIISVKTTTTFTLTNADDQHRHRSKFNKGKKQKPKKKKKQKNRRKPGSQEELNSLVFTLKSSCPGADYARIVTETIRYLIRVQEITLATELYKRYCSMHDSVANIQAARIQQTKKGKVEAEKRTREIGEISDGDHHVLIDLPEEKEVDALRCATLDSSLIAFFGYLSVV